MTITSNSRLDGIFNNTCLCHIILLLGNSRPSVWEAQRSTAINKYPGEGFTDFVILQRTLRAVSCRIDCLIVWSQGCEIGIKSFLIALKFGRRLGSKTAEPPRKFQSDMSILMPNPEGLGIWETLQSNVQSDIKTNPTLLVNDTLCEYTTNQMPKFTN